ncbi:MAG: amidohydrolase family protein [Patescibacteria group bacterium]
MSNEFSELKNGLEYRQKDITFSTGRNSKSRYTMLREGNPRKVLIHGIPFLITINQNDKLEVLSGRSILIEDGVIVKILKATELSFVDLTEIDLIYDAEQGGGIVVTPGLVNAHAHPPMYLLRSTLTFSEANLEKTLRGMARLEGKMNEDDFFLGAVGDFTEQQKFGISTTLSHYGVFNPIDDAAKLTGQVVINAISAVSNSHPENTPAMVEKYLKNKAKYHTEPAIAIHEPSKASEAIFKKVRILQKKYNALFTIHVAETKESLEKSVKKFGEHPVKTLDRFGLLNPRTMMSHVVHVGREEVALILKRKAGVVHLPTSNLLHRSGQFDYPLFHKLKATGQIALGTDSVVSKNRLDLLTEALQTKTMHQNRKIVPYSDLFNMITAQGARLLGLKKVGKLLPGYRADIAFWKLQDRGFLPYNSKDPKTLVSNMITYGGRNIRDLMINGSFVISNRKHNFINETNLLMQLQLAHMQLRKKI